MTQISNPEDIIQMKDVSLYQNDFQVLRDVNLKLKEGEFAYIIGKTGSGKSTLLKSLYGALPIISGDAHVAGFDLKKIKTSNLYTLRRSLGIVFQDFQLLTDRNVHDNLRFVLKATGWKDEHLIEEKINDVLDKVGLKNKGYKMPFEMSGGEQQRVDIARALLNSPKLILADEPTGNLDPETSDEIMQLLIQISKDYGTSVLMATHDFIVINRYPSRMLKTENSRVIDSLTAVS
jgi:cell division transport system ATP-binding protein